MKLNKHLSQKMIISSAKLGRFSTHYRDWLIQILAWLAWLFFVFQAIINWF